MLRTRIAGLLLAVSSFSANAALLTVDYQFLSSSHDVLDTNVLGVNYQVDSAQGITTSFQQYGYEVFNAYITDSDNPTVSLPANNGFLFSGYQEELRLLRDIDKTTGEPTSPWRNFGGTGPYYIGTRVVSASEPNSNYYFQGGNAVGYTLEDRLSYPAIIDVFNQVFATITETAPPPPALGQTPENPVVETFSCASPSIGCFRIPLSVDPDGLGGSSPIFVDPVVAVGYAYEIGSAGVFFDSVLIPEQGLLLDGSTLELVIGGQSPRLLTVGTTFDFSGLGLTNLNRFVIQGIDELLGLLPGDPTAFVTGLTFAASGGAPLPGSADLDLSMTAITVDTDAGSGGSLPVPPTLMLVLLAIGSLVFCKRLGSRGPGRSA